MSNLLSLGINLSVEEYLDLKRFENEMQEQIWYENREEYKANLLKVKMRQQRLDENLQAACQVVSILFILIRRKEDLLETNDPEYKANSLKINKGSIKEAISNFKKRVEKFCVNEMCYKYFENSISSLFNCINLYIGVEAQEKILLYIQQARMFIDQGILLDSLDPNIIFNNDISEYDYNLTMQYSNMMLLMKPDLKSLELDISIEQYFTDDPFLNKLAIKKYKTNHQATIELAKSLFELIKMREDIYQTVVDQRKKVYLLKSNSELIKKEILTFQHDIKNLFSNQLCNKFFDIAIKSLLDCIYYSAIGEAQEKILMGVQQVEMFANQGIKLDNLNDNQ